MSLHGAQILVFQDAIRKHEYKIWVCAAPKLHLNMCSRGKSGKYPYYITLLKWGHFDRAKLIFKMPLVSWTDTESTDEV